MKGILSRRLLKAKVHTTYKLHTQQERRSLRRARRVHSKQPIAPASAAPCEADDEEEDKEEENVNQRSAGKLKKEAQRSSPDPPQSLIVEEKVEEKEVAPSGPLIPEEWQAAVQSIVWGEEGVPPPTPVVFICGGKNAGKSTFGRYLVNSLLNRYNEVGFLDTDVGQPELTPSGCVSLHILARPILGMSALEMRNPERCCFYGELSPKVDPEFYLQSIFSLYNIFSEKYASVSRNSTPLVINTHGWIQGVGFDVLVDIICHARPTHVVQILLKAASKNLPRNKFWDIKANNVCNTKLFFLDSAVGGKNQLVEIKFNARELCDLRLVSYFRKGFTHKHLEGTSLQSLFTETAVALASIKPFQVPASTVNVVHLHYSVPLCESLYCLNASIVGLGVSSMMTTCGQALPKVKPPCIGLGIVRGVDFQRKILYVITPLPLERLQQVDTFLHGRLELPITLLKAPGYISPYLCRNTISIEGTGSAVMGSGKKKFLRS